jgi:hypothetical protein
MRIQNKNETLTTMKKQYLLSVFLWTTIILNAQGREPEFSFKLYFETAGGSKDTIELGYDGSATNSVDTSFGEVEYDSPVSIDKFRVFINAAHNQDCHGYKSFLRKQILHKNMIMDWGDIQLNFSTDGVAMLFPKDSLPVTIKWDKELFNNFQHDYSAIVNRLTESTWWESVYYDDCWDDDTNTVVMYSGTCTDFKLKLKERDQVMMASTQEYLCLNKQDTFALFGIAFINNSFWERLKNESLSISSSLSIHPNPVSDICYIKNENGKDVKKVQVYDMSGKSVLSFDGNITQFPCSTLKKGVYAVLIETEDGRKSYKLVKQ